MSKARELIEALAAEGRVDSRGEISLDREKAREKLGAFQFSDPAWYVLELVQAAHAQGATYIRVDVDANDLRVAFDGAPFTFEDLDRLYDALLGAGAGHTDGRRLLASGIHAASSLGSRRIQVRSGDGERGVVLTMEPGEEDDYGMLEADVPEGTVITLRERASLAGVSRYFKDKRGELPEEVLLRQRCVHATARVDLEGELISSGHLRPSTAIPTPDASRVELRLDPRSRAAPTLRLISYGVWLESEDLWETHPEGALVIADASHLKKDVSRAAFVRDEAYDALVVEARLTRLSILEALLGVAERVHEARDDLRDELRDAEVRARLLEALERDGGASCSSILGTTLWSDVHEQPVTVADGLRAFEEHAPLLYTTCPPDRVPTSPLPFIVLTPKEEDVEALRRSFPDAVSCDTIVHRIRRCENGYQSYRHLWDAKEPVPLDLAARFVDPPAIPSLLAEAPFDLEELFDIGPGRVRFVQRAALPGIDALPLGFTREVTQSVTDAQHVVVVSPTQQAVLEIILADRVEHDTDLERRLAHGEVRVTALHTTERTTLAEVAAENPEVILTGSFVQPRALAGIHDLSDDAWARALALASKDLEPDLPRRVYFFDSDDWMEDLPSLRDRCVDITDGCRLLEALLSFYARGGVEPPGEGGLELRGDGHRGVLLPADSLRGHEAVIRVHLAERLLYTTTVEAPCGLLAVFELDTTPEAWFEDLTRAHIQGADIAGREALFRAPLLDTIARHLPRYVCEHAPSALFSALAWASVHLGDAEAARARWSAALLPREDLPEGQRVLAPHPELRTLPISPTGLTLGDALERYRGEHTSLPPTQAAAFWGMSHVVETLEGARRTLFDLLGEEERPIMTLSERGVDVRLDAVPDETWALALTCVEEGAPLPDAPREVYVDVPDLEIFPSLRDRVVDISAAIDFLQRLRAFQERPVEAAPGASQRAFSVEGEGFEGEVVVPEEVKVPGELRLRLRVEGREVHALSRPAPCTLDATIDLDMTPEEVLLKTGVHVEAILNAIADRAPAGAARLIPKCAMKLLAGVLSRSPEAGELGLSAAEPALADRWLRAFFPLDGRPVEERVLSPTAAFKELSVLEGVTLSEAIALYRRSFDVERLGARALAVSFWRWRWARRVEDIDKTGATTLVELLRSTGTLMWVSERPRVPGVRRFPKLDGIDDEAWSRALSRVPVEIDPEAPRRIFVLPEEELRDFPALEARCVDVTEAARFLVVFAGFEEQSTSVPIQGEDTVSLEGDGFRGRLRERPDMPWGRQLLIIVRHQQRVVERLAFKAPAALESYVDIEALDIFAILETGQALLSHLEEPLVRAAAASVLELPRHHSAVVASSRLRSLLRKTLFPTSQVREALLALDAEHATAEARDAAYVELLEEKRPHGRVWLDTFFPRSDLPLEERILQPHASFLDAPFKPDADTVEAGIQALREDCGGEPPLERVVGFW